ncbi:diguanylate cyclase [Candidatus Bipolaricaulota bacterium]|nr:diguanylate cyclase [Candidatus Bipolaricaulota bacterium]
MDEKDSKSRFNHDKVSLDKLSSASSDAITKVDGSGRLLYADSKANNLLGLNEKDITGLSYENFDWRIIDFQGNDYPPEDLPFRIAQETGEPIKDVKLALEWPTGERKFLSINPTPLFDDQGNFEAALNLMEDVTEAEKEANGRRAQFEHLLRELSTRFLKRETSEHGPIIEEGLERIGKFLGVDRSYVFEFDREQGEMSNTNEWCGEGIEPQIDNLQGIPNSRFPALMNKLNDRENILIQYVSDLPESWEAEREVFESHDIQSLLVVPISRGSDLFGFAGFDSVRRNRKWGEKEVNLLRIFGNLVGAALFRQRSERKIEESEKGLELALEGGELGTWDWNVKTNELRFNKRWAEMLGYELEELEPHLSTWKEMVHPDDLPKAREKLNEHLEGKTDGYEAEFRMQHKSGDWIWVQAKGKVIERDEEGNSVRASGTHQDITDRKKAEQALNEERNKLKNLHDVVDELQQQDTEQDLLQHTIEVAERALEFEICSIMLVRGDQLVSEALSPGVAFKAPTSFKSNEGVAGETLQKGQTVWLDDVRNFSEAKEPADRFRAAISSPIGELGVIQVISEEVADFDKQDVELTEILAGHLREELKRVRLEGELRQQAIRDPLTGLYNRRYFNETLKKEVQKAERYENPLAFLMIDVNRFKEINDRYSHQTGDEVLREVANLLEENVRAADTVVRYGGDEFLVMMPETNGGSKNTVKRLQDKLSQWNRDSNLLDFPLTLAMGISHWSPNQDRNVEEALNEADKKMYKDKRR